MIKGCGQNNNIPAELWHFLGTIPGIRYMKEPVDTVQDLYDKYKNKAERGSFAYVIDKNTFYAWDFDNKKWIPIDNAFSLLFEMNLTELMENGDTLVWDNTKQKFIVVNLMLWATEEY